MDRLGCGADGRVCTMCARNRYGVADKKRIKRQITIVKRLQSNFTCRYLPQVRRNALQERMRKTIRSPIDQLCNVFPFGHLIKR